MASTPRDSVGHTDMEPAPLTLWKERSSSLHSQERFEEHLEHYHQQEQHHHNHHYDHHWDLYEDDDHYQPRQSQHSQQSLSSHLRRQTLDRIDTNSPIASAVTSPIKRKPLSSTASPLAVRYSNQSSSCPPSQVKLPQPDQRFARPCSVDSPILYDDPLSYMQAAAPGSPPHNVRRATADATAKDSERIPDADRADDQTDYSDVLSEYDDLFSDLTPAEHYNATKPASPAHEPFHTNVSSTGHEAATSPFDSHTLDKGHRDSSPSMFAPKPTPPHLNLQTVDSSSVRKDSESETPTADAPYSTRLNKPLPKSPSQPSPFAALFGWGNQSNLSPSATEFSSIPSPSSPMRNVEANESAYRSANQDNREGGPNSHVAAANFLGYCESYLSTPPPSNNTSTVQIDEMEDELKAISSELASSIRREIDLEDLVDRLQEQVNYPQAPSKRTSDYFSDSGYSSSKISEFDQGKDEIEKIQRRSEQEKASIRLELTNKLQDERSQRKVLDFQIKELAEKASQIDLAQMNSLDANGRVRELENACEDLRRKLSEERSSKTNFEDLLSALKGQLHEACNERDNLRDEIVPQLRARVEGLETEAAEYSNLTYESTKMQQELETLKEENTALKRTSRALDEAPASRMSRVMSGGLSRSNSVALGSLRNQRSGGVGLSRSNSVKNVQLESREALAERLKDVEAQRDALHSALKSLLDRQEYQNRENEKKIKLLESERHRLLAGPTKKAGFEKEISGLRTEINVLRRRAEDALEQKWQVEKGLGGLKMDLDRAEEEIASLRALLKGEDILTAPFVRRSSSSSDASTTSATSDSLGKAFEKLQADYSESLERIKSLERGNNDAAAAEQTQLAIQRLEISLSTALAERDAARQHANVIGDQLGRLASQEGSNIGAEQALADELSESAARIEQLASQVQNQLSANSALRHRLSEAVARGETDRKSNMERITGLMERLRSLEEHLMSAQTASEDRVIRHEEEISSIREAHNEQLRRMDSSPGLGGMRSPGLKTPRKFPLLAPETSLLHPRSQRLQAAKSFEDEAEMKVLRSHVAALEKALADAEHEMQDVVGKMSAAQIEVMNLQEEREMAARETARLQQVLEQQHGSSLTSSA